MQDAEELGIVELAKDAVFVTDELPIGNVKLPEDAVSVTEELLLILPAISMAKAFFAQVRVSYPACRQAIPNPSTYRPETESTGTSLPYTTIF